MLSSPQLAHHAPSSTACPPKQETRTAHPLDQLILHLLPGRIPGLTQKELMQRIPRALPHWPDLAMTEVRPPVLSSVLARLQRQKLIDAAGEGAQRCYWRLVPPALSDEQEAMPSAIGEDAPAPADRTETPG